MAKRYSVLTSKQNAPKCPVFTARHWLSPTRSAPAPKNRNKWRADFRAVKTSEVLRAGNLSSHPPPLQINMLWKTQPMSLPAELTWASPKATWNGRQLYKPGATCYFWRVAGGCFSEWRFPKVVGSVSFPLHLLSAVLRDSRLLLAIEEHLEMEHGCRWLKEDGTSLAIAGCFLGKHTFSINQNQRKDC